MHMLTFVDFVNNLAPFKYLNAEKRKEILGTIATHASPDYLQAWATSQPALRLITEWMKDALTKDEFRETMSDVLHFIQCLPGPLQDNNLLETAAQALVVLNLAGGATTTTGTRITPTAPSDIVRSCPETISIVHPSPSDTTSFEVLLDGCDSRDIPMFVEAAVRMIVSEESQQPTDRGGIYILEAIIQKVLGSEALYQHIMTLKGEEAQLVIDALQLYLNCDGPREDQHRVMKALVRMSRKCDVIPSCLTLDAVTRSGLPMTAGSFGDVYKGQYLGGDVAIKVIRIYERDYIPAVNKAVSREAIIWSQLWHPNVLPLLGIFNFEQGFDQISLVSPWMQRGNVVEYLKKNPFTNRLLLLNDIASGMQCLHQNHIVHGDLKGVNILVTPSGHACLADFGLAKVGDADGHSWTAMTRTSNGLTGTTRWTAPELFHPDADVVPQPTMMSDIWSFGCVCYEIMTSKVPYFELNREHNIMFKIFSGVRPTKPSLTSASSLQLGLTAAVWALIEECWEVRPSATAILESDVLKKVRVGDTRHASGWKFGPSRFERGILEASKKLSGSPSSK